MSLYLISQEFKKGSGKDRKWFHLLKIGYTTEETKKRRYKAYELHAPSSEILFEIPGTRSDESALHSLFSKYNYGGEWFNYTEEIVNYFSARSITEEIPAPKELDGLIYWEDMQEVLPWLCGKYGVSEEYLKILFDFKEPNFLNNRPFILGGEVYANYLQLLDTIFRVIDGRKARSIKRLQDIKNDIDYLVYYKGYSLSDAIAETNKTLDKTHQSTNT